MKKKMCNGYIIGYIAFAVIENRIWWSKKYRVWMIQYGSKTLRDRILEEKERLQKIIPMERKEE